MTESNTKGSKKNLQNKFTTRQYMISNKFEIYYYSDRKKQHVQSHTHNFYEFYFFLEGDVRFAINDVSYPISKGDFLIIPPNTEHFVETISNKTQYRRFVLWISRDYLDALNMESTDYTYLIKYVKHNKKYIFNTNLITYNHIQSLIYLLLEEQKSNRFGKDIQCSLHVNSLLLFLNRILYNEENKSPVQGKDSLIPAIKDYIMAHLDEDLTLDNIANTFYVSKYYISHLMKDDLGISLHQYILKIRLTECSKALLSHEPINKIFTKYGFTDYSVFYRAFKKEFGISPQEYRAKGRILC